MYQVSTIVWFCCWAASGHGANFLTINTNIRRSTRLSTVYASSLSVDLWGSGVGPTLPHLGIHDCKPSMTGIPGKSLAKHHCLIVKLRPIRRMPRGCQHTHPRFTPLISNPLLSFVPPLTLTALPEIQHALHRANQMRGDVMRFQFVPQRFPLHPIHSTKSKKLTFHPVITLERRLLHRKRLAATPAMVRNGPGLPAFSQVRGDATQQVNQCHHENLRSEWITFMSNCQRIFQIQSLRSAA